MKQRIIIGLSVLFLILAVLLIGFDLFRNKNADIRSSSLMGEMPLIKQFDTSLVGFVREKLWETGLNSLTGISINDDRVIVCGDSLVAIYDTIGHKTFEFMIDSPATCIYITGNSILIGMQSAAIRTDFSGNIISRFEIPFSGSRVTSITSDGNYVYIADAGKKRVLKFDNQGRFVKEFSRKDCCADGKGFIIPGPYFDIAISGDNNLWIVNPGKLRIEKYSVAGKLQSGWGEDLDPDTRFSGHYNPVHFGLLPDGGFVTYEKGNDKIKVFDREGKFRAMVGGAGSFKGKSDFMPGSKNLVKDLATDQSGRIYILDAYNKVNVYRSK